MTESGPRIPLLALARRELDAELDASSGRSARTLYGGRDRALRQTLIALRAGVALDEHENPGDATVAVLIGRVALRWGANSAEGVAGDLLVVPDARHSLEALEDSVVVLSAVPSR